MKQIASFSLGDLAMNSFNTEIHSDEFDEPTAADWQEFAEWAEMQEAQQEVFFEGMFPEGHTDAAYDALKNANVFGGIFN